MVLTAVLAVMAAQSGTSPSSPPRFDRFPAPVARIEHDAPVRIISARDRRFRSSLKAATKGGTGFAGHWMLAQIGCGAFCFQVAAIDRISGRVIWFPTTICCWPLAVMESLEYQRDSRLLLVQGELDEKGAASTHAFIFDGHRFVALGA